MLRQIISIVIILGLTSCDHNEHSQQTVNNSGTSAIDSVVSINSLNIQTSSFSEIDSSGILMFSLSMGESEREGISSSYKEMPNDSYWNIIFHNTKTNEHHLLSDKKMLIRNTYFNYNSDENINVLNPKKHIFYSITSEDFNKDKRITFEDPEYLFVTDRQGNNFRQISPSNYNLESWQFVKVSNKIVMTLKKDSNKNLKFDRNDEVVTFEINLDSGVEAKEVFSVSFKNELIMLFDRDWKRIQK